MRAQTVLLHTCADTAEVSGAECGASARAAGIQGVSHCQTFWGGQRQALQLLPPGATRRILAYADVCWRMLTYAGVCWRMLTYADVC